jgi:predicted ATPase/Tfp pilus assembly protein PilF
VFLAEVRTLLLGDAARLVTLVGPGGVGKTRLAQELVVRLSGSYRDGVVFVPLAPIPSLDLVPQAVLQALGLMENGGCTIELTVRAALQGRELLLVLDNVEHVVGTAEWVTSLLGDCPRLTVLATSRVPLGVRGEQQVLLTPLPLPPAELTDPELLRAFASVLLFEERVRALTPGFTLTHTNGATVGALCACVDGLPLAIELVAARCKVLSPHALLTRLRRTTAGSTLDLLAYGPTDVPDRHKTLRAAITWSFDLLPLPEQRLLVRLGCFVGTWSLEAAEVICADEKLPVLDGMQTLVNHSLISAQVTDDGPPAFMMLELIREYALERLAVSGEADELRRRHAEYYCATAEQLAPHITSRDQMQVLAELERMQDNLRAALTWAVSHGEYELVARTCVALHRFWRLRGQFYEAWRWMHPVLGAPLGNTTRARVLHSAGVIALGQHNSALAADYWEKALELWRTLGDPLGEALTLANYANTLVSRGNYSAGLQLLSETLPVFRTQGNSWQVATNLNNMGLVAVYLADYDKAQKCYRESLRLYEALGDQHGEAIVMANLGEIALLEREYAQAELFYRASLAARAALNNPPGVASMLDVLAHIAASTGRLACAARLAGAAAALRGRIGAQKTGDEEQMGTRTDTLIRAGLPAHMAAADRRMGASLTMEEAIAEALRQGS